MENNRLYATIQSDECPFKCIYCFTQCDNFKKNILIDSLSDEELHTMTENIDIIQPACDTEFLLHPRWKDILMNLAKLNKNISFATKMLIKDDDIVFLKSIDRLLKRKNKILNIGVTIVKVKDYKELEPNAPSPKMRIKNLKRLFDAGISCNIIIRPIFPNLSFEEIDSLIEMTHNYTEGYLVGPLYTNDKVLTYLKDKQCPIKEKQKSPGWNQHKNLDVIYCHEIMTYIGETTAKYRKQVFFSNEQCIQYVLDKLFKGGNND